MGEGEGKRVIFKILTYCDEVKGSNARELLTAVISRPKKRKVAALPNDAPKCQGKNKKQKPLIFNDKSTKPTNLCHPSFPPKNHCQPNHLWEIQKPDFVSLISITHFPKSLQTNKLLLSLTS